MKVNGYGTQKELMFALFEVRHNPKQFLRVFSMYNA